MKGTIIKVFLLAMLFALPLQSIKAYRITINDVKAITTSCGTGGNGTEYWGPGNEPDKVIDGNTNTFWFGPKIQATDDHVTLELHELQEIDNIKITFASDELPKSVRIEISEDGTSWIQSEVFNVSANSQHTFNANGKKAKFARMVVVTPNTSKWIKLAEFEINTTLTERTISAVAQEGGSFTIDNQSTSSVTSDCPVTLTAQVQQGYTFVEWQLDGVTVSTNATFRDCTNGNKTYTAVFRTPTAEEKYAEISKPTISKVNNPTFVNAAIIKNGNGIVDTNDNLVPENQRTKYQAGATAPVTVAKGASFDLVLTYKLNWNDLTIVKIEDGKSEKIYGTYDGKWAAGASNTKVFTYIANDGISVEALGGEMYTVTYPITVSENAKDGDIMIIRSLAANNYDINQSSLTDATYIDFIFVVGGYDLTVSSVGYSTLYLGANAIIPDNAEVYVANRANDTHVFLEQVTGVLPKNTGVIVKAEAGKYKFKYTIDEAEEIPINFLRGSVKDEYIDEESYVLANKNGVGLYLASMNKDATGNSGTTHFKNNANKAYLPVSSLAGTIQRSADLRFDFGGTTDINDIAIEENNVADTIYYDLQGRRMNEITRPGIYIINGKKVLVK